MAERDVEISFGDTGFDKVLKKTKQLDSGLNDLKALGEEIGEGMAEGFTKSGEATKELSGQAKLLRQAMSGVASIGLGKLALDTVKNMVSMAAEMEQTQVSLTTMLKGNEKVAKGILDMLNEFANVTPYTNKQVINAGRTLISFSSELRNNTDMLDDTVKMIGDISSISTGTIEEISLIYGKIISKGRVTMEELSQLSQRGMSIQENLQKLLNVNKDEFRKLLESGQISADHITASI